MIDPKKWYKAVTPRNIGSSTLNALNNNRDPISRMPYHNYMIILGGSEVLQKSRWCAKGTTFLVCHTVNFRWYDRCGSSTLWLKILTYLLLLLQRWSHGTEIIPCNTASAHWCKVLRKDVLSLNRKPSPAIVHTTGIAHWPLAIPREDVRD